ncbi:MAG TPA: DNA polymerase IV [Prolixibacteraceae bacterium]|nr:DNA polymerase IV [Prolixibacteraceae bacterium]
MRKIIHIDMDAFYASVEQRDNPALRGKPVAVGGDTARGVVAAASYEARRYGVRSAISSKVAHRRCPDLIFVRPRFDVYKAVSEQIRSIFFEYTDLVEPLSLDEAYLDVTYAKKGKPSATLIAREIKSRIFVETGLTASAGVSFNKFLAKVASDINKPDGLFVITPDQAEAFIDNLEVRKFYGIGKVTAQKMNQNGLWFGRDLRKLDRHELIRLFGKAGNYYYEIVRGIDDRPVVPFHERKSLGAENTFETDLFLFSQMVPEIEQVVATVWRRLQRSGLKGRTLTLKIKFADFEQITRSKTRQDYYTSAEMILDEGLKLLKAEEPFARGIRLLGLTLSNFYIPEKGPVQLVLNF